jgi:hypothetical protein
VQPTNTAKARTKQAFAGVCVLELIMDASRFGSVDTEIFIAYDAKRQIAAFLPPQELRELSWRQTAAGSAITAEDRKRYEEKGLTTTRGMKVLDTIRTLNHVLNHGFEDLSLATFRLPFHLLQLLPTGFVRIWDSATSCWVRVSSRPESSSGSQVAELPASILKSLIANRLGEIKTLLLTMDQAGWGWSAGHWLLGGFGIHGDFREDSFHRSWNDFLGACSRATGGIRATMLQMFVPYNCRFMPWGRAANKQKIKEYMLEYTALHPVPKDDWLELAAQFASDANLPAPATQSDLDDLVWQTDPGHGGPYYRMGAWYSIIPAIMHKDEKFRAWQLWMRWLAKACAAPEKKGLKHFRDKAWQVLKLFSKLSFYLSVHFLSFRRQSVGCDLEILCVWPCGQSIVCSFCTLVCSTCQNVVTLVAVAAVCGVGSTQNQIIGGSSRVARGG